jgi:hypothetical protein
LAAARFCLLYEGNAGIAQLVEQLICNQQVVGSNPTAGSLTEAYVEPLSRQLGDYRAQALGLSDRQKLEASECYRLLEGQNASLLQAVHHYLQYREDTKRSVPLGELFDAVEFSLLIFLPGFALFRQRRECHLRRLSSRHPSSFQSSLL